MNPTITPIQSPEETEARADRFAQRLAEAIGASADELAERELISFRAALDIVLGGAR